MGLVAKVPRSGTCDIPLLQPFQAPADTVKNITEELHYVVAQYAVGSEAAQLHLAPSSSGEVPPDVIIQDIAEGAKGVKKRRKQHRQETTTTAVADSGNNNQAGSSGVARAMAIVGSRKHQEQPPTDHFEKVLEETCSNHAYPIKHKLRDCA
jgi:hypothetical protein